METERFKRQLDIVDPDKYDFPIHILGVGGIGSWAALLLAKMGAQYITIYDEDKVEDHNVASQFFKESQLGELKTSALADNIEEHSGLIISTKDLEKEKEIEKGLVIIAIDSMEARWSKANLFAKKDLFIIDARMGGLQLEIYFQHANEYVSTLVPPLEVENDSCTGSSICFNCAVIGGLLANYVRKYADGERDKQEILFEFNDISLFKG